MIEPDSLAKIIKYHRKAAGLSQLQLAELACIGKTVVYDIEKGKESIRLNTLQKIFRVLNIKIELTSPLMDNLRKTWNEKG